jgi:hypothetical protein
MTMDKQSNDNQATVFSRNKYELARLIREIVGVTISISKVYYIINYKQN